MWHLTEYVQKPFSYFREMCPWLCFSVNRIIMIWMYYNVL